MSFRGFGPQAIPFLKALAFHQNKEWFEANRITFERDAKEPMGDLIEDLSATFAKAKIPLKGDRKASIFRQNRDVRFAKDKSPYKTNLGAVMSRGGAKNDKGFLYIHLSPERCFSAAGFYMPEPADLAKMRSAIVRAPKVWAEIAGKLSAAGFEFMEEDALKRLPKGFEDVADPAVAEAIKRKTIVCGRDIAEARLGRPELVAELVDFTKKSMPLMNWGWAAIADERTK